MAFAFATSRRATAGINKRATFRGLINGRPADQRRKPALLPRPPEVMIFIPGERDGFGARSARHV